LQVSGYRLPVTGYRLLRLREASAKQGPFRGFCVCRYLMLCYKVKLLQVSGFRFQVLSEVEGLAPETERSRRIGFDFTFHDCR
jgi:hypothetical protein